MKKQIYIITFIVTAILLFGYFNNQKSVPAVNGIRSETLIRPTPGKTGKPQNMDNPGGAGLFRHQMVTGSMKDVDPVKMRNEAIKFSKDKMKVSSHMQDNPNIWWSAIGPSNIGGRIRSLLINPSSPAIMLCGAVSGGVWKTTDAGARWDPKLDHGDPISIGSMIIDPLNPNIVYAGTGEGWVDLYGGGIYKSTDFGETWYLLPSTHGIEASKFRNVKKMDSDASGNIYAATIDERYSDGVYNFSYDGGLYRSGDQGNSWTKISSYDINTNYFNPNDLIVINQYEIIYAVGSMYYNQGIYKTLDGGNTWFQVTSGLPASNYERIAMTQDPNNSHVIYAAIQSLDYSASGDAGLKGIYKSMDFGNSWVALPRPGNLVSAAGLSYMGMQGWYDNVIAVDPHNSNNIYVGGIDMMKSTDAGMSWFQLTYWDPYFGGPVVHADHHVITFDPNTPGIIYSGNDGGVWRSLNGGSTWQQRNTLLQNTQFYGGAAFPRGHLIWGGTQDNGQLMTKISANWSKKFGGDGGYSAQHNKDQNIAYEEYVYLDMRKTTTQGATWNSCLNGLTDAGNPYLCLFIAPFAMNRDSSEVLAAGSDKFWITTNGADNWSQVSYTFYSGARVSAVTVENENSNYLCFAGTTNGKIFRANSLDPNLGTSNQWYDITPPGNNGGWVRRIVVDPNNYNNLYACYSGYNPNPPFNSRHLYYSPDQGITWVDISTSLPNVPIHTIVIDTMAVNGGIYIGTETGVYLSTNNGISWSTFNMGMASFVPVDELVLQGESKRLLAFSFGRGVWDAALHEDVISMIIWATTEGLYNPATNRMNIRDTFTLQVRTNFPPYNVVASSKALQDSISLIGDHVLKNVPTGAYYIVTKHRNSIETWSSGTFNISPNPTVIAYDYIFQSSTSYGNNVKQVDNSPLRFAFFSGDVNQDGSIDLTDIIQTFNDANVFLSGYVSTDVTGDNYVDLSDVAITFNNSNNFVTVVRP